MVAFNKDMVALATRNTHFQQEVYLDKRVQIVLMQLLPGEDIGMESHRADQTTFFVTGEGKAEIDGASTKVGANHMIVIRKGPSTTSRTPGRSRSSCSPSMRRRPSPPA